MELEVSPHRSLRTILRAGFPVTLEHASGPGNRAEEPSFPGDRLYNE